MRYDHRSIYSRPLLLTSSLRTQAAKSSERPDEDSDAADIAQSPMSDDQQGERRTVASPESSTGEGGAAPLHPHIAVHGMESVPNLRDVATTSPSHVAAGVLFRSGTPANATCVHLSFPSLSLSFLLPLLFSLVLPFFFVFSFVGQLSWYNRGTLAAL